MKYIFLLISFTSLWSCTESTVSDIAERDEDSTLKSVPFVQNPDKYPEITSEENIENLASIIASKNRVFGRSVGITGEYSKSYACFERINEIASISELFNLLKHDSAAVKVYAFWCLKSRDSLLADSARVLLRNDTSSVLCLSGCIQNTRPVSFLVAKNPTFTEDTSGNKILISY